MAHGFIEYRGRAMLNCHEGICGYIGGQLHALSLTAHFSAIAPVVRVWKEALMVGAGSSRIGLDDVLADEATKDLFTEALTDLYPSFGEDQPRTKDLVRQLIAFLALGESALERGYRPAP